MSCALLTIGSIAAMNIAVLTLQLLARAFLRRELRLLREEERRP